MRSYLRSTCVLGHIWQTHFHAPSLRLLRLLRSKSELVREKSGPSILPRYGDVARRERRKRRERSRGAGKCVSVAHRERIWERRRTACN